MRADMLPAGPEEQRHARLYRRVTATEPYEVGIVLPFDLHTDLITVAQAAELAFGWTASKARQRRNELVIHTWVRRPHLPAQARCGPRGGARFYGIDAPRAEAKTRERARRSA